MRKRASLIAAIFFWLIALAQLLRAGSASSPSLSLRRWESGFGESAGSRARQIGLDLRRPHRTTHAFEPR